MNWAAHIPGTPHTHSHSHSSLDDRLGPNTVSPSTSQPTISTDTPMSTGTGPNSAISGSDAAVNSPPPTTGPKSNCL